MAEVVVTSLRATGPKPSAGFTLIDITRKGSMGLGNPDELLAKGNPESRARVVKAQKDRTDADIAIKGPIYQSLSLLANRLNNGENIALACWCAPQACHGDYYREKIYEMAGRPLHRTVSLNESSTPEQPSLF